MLAGVATCILFVACGGSADRKVPELADEMCNCFTSMEKELSPEGLAILKATATAADPQAEMTKGIGKLKPAEALVFGQKIQSIADKGSAVYACLEAFDKKHGKETTKDKKALTKRMLNEMRSKGDCPVGAAVVNLSVAKMN